MALPFYKMQSHLNLKTILQIKNLVVKVVVVNLAFIASLPIGNVNKAKVCKMGKTNSIMMVAGMRNEG